MVSILSLNKALDILPGGQLSEQNPVVYRQRSANVYREQKLLIPLLQQ